jgi:flagellar motor switch protein FliG
MASLANSDTTSREAAMRRVAIVLSSLPASVAAKLLGSVDQESKQTIRRTMATLSDVDPLERHRALIAFKASVQKSPDHPVDTFQSSSNSISVSDSSASPVIKPSRDGRSAEPAAPLDFLADLDDDSLVNLMANEHAQAVALVLASVSPSQAARVLPRLAPELRSSALSRLGRLGDVPEAAVTEIAEHFHTRLQRQRRSTRASDSATTGQRALDAILAAMPPSPAPRPQPVAVSNAEADEFRSSQPIPVPLKRVADVAMDPAVDKAVAPLRIAPQTQADAAPPSTKTPKRTAEPSSLSSTDAIHNHLIGLKPNDLCIALGRVDTRTAMLALCGLPNAKAKAVLAILPKAQSQLVRSQMNSLVSMNLREIDVAKERVSAASVGQPASMAA